MERPKKNLLSVNVTTVDCLRIDFLMDRLLEIQRPVLLVGPTAQGKSSFIRNYVVEKDNPSKPMRYDLYGMSNCTTSNKLYLTLEAKLVKHSRSILQPADEKHQVYFLDDIHMCWKD